MSRLDSCQWPDLVRPWCVWCGKPASNLHHEPPKGLGGTKSHRAVISLCGSGTTGCHGLRHAGRVEFGYDAEAGRWYGRWSGGEWRPLLEDNPMW